MQAHMLSQKLNGRSARFRVAQFDDTLEIHDSCRRYLLKRKPAYAFEKTAAAQADAVRAPMPGRIVSVTAEKIAELRASVAEFVEADAVLARLERGPGFSEIDIA